MYTKIDLKELDFGPGIRRFNAQRLIRKISRMRKSCTGVGGPRSCGFHAKIYNNHHLHSLAVEERREE